jgi:hypothetical protein
MNAVPSLPKATAFVLELFVRVRRPSGSDAANGSALNARMS